ncbi:MAG: cupin domain-containing protein [Sphingomicrobium sp.]
MSDERSRAGGELKLVTGEFDSALALLRGLGLRLDVIYPADDPHTAVLVHGDGTVRLTSQPDAPVPPAELPAFQPDFVVSLAGGSANAGRAGMQYRDCIPGRLGGRYIASHITIADGGPVADWVHYHRVAFQMICVRTGWVRVVYEDQGEPFVMRTGDMVLQPPGIRHRVLESSPGLEVVEVSSPALHETFADHAMVLPNKRNGPERDFGGQRFLHHVSADMPWTQWRGAQAQETGMKAATDGLADVRTLRPGEASEMAFQPHDGELVFGFVMAGSAHLSCGESHRLGPADAFVIPPGESWRLVEPSADFRLLHVATATASQPLSNPGVFL